MSVCQMDDSPWCFPGTCKDCDAAREPTRPAYKPVEPLPARPLDSMIGRMDRLLSEFLVAAEGELDEPDWQTMKHHADDLIGVGNAALEKLRARRKS